ncbi:MAG: hypothetical protein NC311_03985 [Muribaculaceae bacterium]|nr:hypothetical protein [Muribaculaceae bacterium]
MKKAILVSLFAIVACGGAFASDGGVYYESETVSTRVVANASTATYGAPRRTVVSASRPCARRAVAVAPVRVKTYTEVIDHYQVYQPVTVYKPVGAYAQRRVIESPRPCGCGK